jgi:hypothetical protein
MKKFDPKKAAKIVYRLHWELKRWTTLALFLTALLFGILEFIPATDSDMYPEASLHYLRNSILCFLISLIAGAMNAHVMSKRPKKDGEDDEGGYSPDGFV